jgi:hypothetical protein
MRTYEKPNEGVAISIGYCSPIVGNSNGVQRATELFEVQAGMVGIALLKAEGLASRLLDGNWQA